MDTNHTPPNNPETIKVVLVEKSTPVIGIISTVFSVASLFPFLGILSVPGTIMGVIALFKKQIVLGIIGTLFGLIGMVTSPILWGIFASGKSVIENHEEISKAYDDARKGYDAFEETQKRLQTPHDDLEDDTVQNNEDESVVTNDNLAEKMISQDPKDRENAKKYLDNKFNKIQKELENPKKPKPSTATEI